MPVLSLGVRVGFRIIVARSRVGQGIVPVFYWMSARYQSVGLLTECSIGRRL